jgi:Concanavalin A-like lectin/glucanases superfamily
MASIVEFPPSGVPTAKLWTKDTADTITGLGNVTYVKYKATLSNKTYGNGLYVTWANSVYNYTAGSTYNASEYPPSGVFDKTVVVGSDSQPGWNTALADANFTSTSDNANPNSLYLQCPIPVVLKYYSIQIGAFTSKAPSKWDLLGSMDGINWTVVDSQSSQTSWTASETKTYYVANVVPYSFYQLKMYRSNGDSYLQLIELKYFGIPYPTATQTGALEFPPTSIGAANTWTKDTGDTISGIGGTTYVKYKYTLSDTSYGTGQYIAWANTIASYSASTSYGSVEKSPSGAFDKEPLTDVNTNKGWATNEATYTNSVLPNPTPQLYLTSPVSFILRYYTLQCRSDTQPNQMPSSWNIYGSLDGMYANSVLIDSQTSQTAWALGEVRTYNTTNQTAFTTYIIECLLNNSGTATNISIGELKYYGTINMPIEGPVLEFPPPLAIGSASTWTKDGTDTIPGIGAQVALNLRKYKFVVPNTHPYGWGEYQAYANTIFGYTNGSSYGFNEWPASGAFDKALAETNLRTGWSSGDAIYNNTTDATTPAELYIKLPIKLFLTHYILRARTTIVTQMPIKWKVYGSNDGVTWTLIDYILNYTSWVIGTNGQTTFFCYSDIPYQYYKLSILRINNATNTNLSIGDWYLFGMMYNVGLNTAQPSVLEYPPPIGILTRSEWTKDLSDSIIGIGGSTYSKYKCTIGSSCPYGQGEYIAWANTIYDYNAGTTYSSTECPPSSAFDKLAFNWTNKCGWQTKEFIWTNANDITTPAELYITLPQKILLLSYALAQRYDTNTRQYPTKWAVYGSNDNINWTLIDTRLDTGTTYFGIERFYTINTMIGSFKSYKISIVRNSFPNEQVHIGEWRLFGIPDVSTTNLEVLEYPPKQIGKGYTWVKDTTDTFISNNYETNPPTTYCKYKYQLNGAPYGNGEYVAWANSIYLGGGTAVSATYGTNEHPPSGVFETSDTGSGKKAWANAGGDLNSKSDIVGHRTPELYIKLPTSIILNSYSISAYSSQLVKNLYKWEVYGSVDGSSWYKLDFRDNEKDWATNEIRTYIIDRAVTVPYNYYKMRIYRNNHSSSELAALSEWCLYGSPIDSVRMFEFPPPDAIGTYTSWEQDTTDQVNSVSGDASIYYRWKNTVSSSHPYGGGEYACWANTNSSAWPVRGLFDPVNVSALIGYATNLATYTNTTDATNPPEIYLRLPVQIAPRKYHIMGRPDSGGISDMQSPSEWMLYGSNDENSWTLLDTRTNETNWSVAEVRNYSCNTTINTGSFRTFKLSLYRNNFSQEREYPPQIITSGMISNTDLGSQLYRQSATISGYPYGSGTYNFYARYVDSLDWNAYGGWKCFDNNDTSFSRGYANHINQTTGVVSVGHYIQIDLPVSVILSRYGLYYTNAFYVSEWTIQGSNNGTSWTNIDTETGITDWTTPYREFTLSGNSTAYNRYRFNPLKCLIAGGNANILVYTWRLFGFEQTTTNIIMGKWKMFGVPQTSTTTQTTPVSYKTMMRDVHYIPDNIYSVMDISGLIGWYKGETWNSSTNQWRDVSGSGNHATTTQGTISTTKWATNGMTYLYGGTTAGIRFPVAILPTTYTLFHVARYNGTVKKRIFDGLSGVNWLSGFWQGLSGVALHGGSAWMTSTTIDQFGSQWVVSTDQNNLYRGQGTNLTVGTPTTGVNDQLTINYGSTTADRGDWAVAEVLVFNRTLNSTEITTIETYLLNKWYNPISIFTQSPAASLSMPTWHSYQSDIQAMPGLVGWYRGDTWRNNKWFDASGNNNHSIATKGTVNVSSLIDRNGLLYLYGDTTTGIRFPTSILPPNYTLFYIAKYTSSSYSSSSQRIFDGNTSNWYSGFKEGYSGHHAYHGVSIGSTSSDVCGTEWVLGTDQKRLFRSQGVTRGSVENVTPSSVYSTQLTINYGSFSTEVSNWAVAEVIVFDRELNMAGIQFVENYLSLKYLIEREVTQSRALTFAGTGKASWRYNITDITNMMTLYQGATRSGTTVSLVNANTPMSYGCALFPFDYKAPGNVYTIESEVLINSTNGTITKNALWLGIGANFVTSRYSWEYDQTNGYNLVTSVQSDFSAADSANTFDVVATNFTTYKQTPITTGLVVNLNFASITSNTVTNSANGSNNFTIGGSYSVVDSPFGKALQVSGQNTYMTATTAISTTTLSCACWYNFQYSNNDGSWITIFGRNGGVNHHLVINVSNGRHELGIYNVNTFTGSGYYLTKGKWTHLALTMTGTTWKLYVNGVFVFTTSSSFNNSSATFGIVSNNTSSGTQGAQGILADVRVYNTQLSDSDIMDIYTQTSPFNQSLISRVPLNADEVVVPPQALTANTTIISSSSYGNGVYQGTVSANLFSSSFAGFDPDATTSLLYWHGTYVYETTNGTYTGAYSTTVNGVAYNGEMIQLGTPSPFRANKLRFTPRQDVSPAYYLYRCPNTFILAGSNDGTSWEFIKSFSSIADWTTSAKVFTINSTKAYTYHRVIITVVGNTTNASYRNCVNISMVLFGHYDNITDTTYTQQEVAIPPAAMTAASTNLSSALYAAGTYIASSSTSFDATRVAWKVFNMTSGPSTDTGNFFATGNAYNTTTGAYTGAVSTTISGSAYTGEWLQIQLPYKLKLTRYVISPRQDSTFYLWQSPNTWKLAGSYDGTTWYIVDTQTSVVDWTTSSKTFVVNSNIPYLYYRLVVNANGSTANGVNRANCSIDLLTFYGYTEDIGWKLVRHYVDLPKRRFRMTIPSQGVDVTAELPSTSLTNTGSTLGFAARTDPHFGNFQLRYCKVLSGWQEFGPLHLPYIDLDAMSLSKLQPGNQINLWRNSGLEGGTSDAVGYTDGTSKPVYLIDAMGQPFVRLNKLQKSFFKIPGTLRFNFISDDNTAINGITVVVVAKVQSTSQWQRVFDFANGTNTNTARNNIIVHFNLLLSGSGLQNDTGISFLGDGSKAYSRFYSRCQDNSWHIYTIRVTNTSTSSTAHVWRDGIPQTIVVYTVDNTTQSLIKHTTTDNLIGKSHYTNDSYADYDLRELLIYRMPLADETIGTINSHLLDKWKLWKESKKCIVHFDASYLATVDGITSGGNISTWKNLGDDNTVIDAIGAGSGETVYPPGPLTADTTTFSSQSYGTGTYIASASTALAPSSAFNAFDNVLNAAWQAVSINENNVYDRTTGAYTGAVTTTISGSSVAGEWLQIQFPTAIVLKRYELTSENQWWGRTPKSFTVAGSNDGITWTTINTQTNSGFTAVSQTISFSTSGNTTYYKYYRIVVQSITAGASQSSWGWMSIAEWNLYGPYYPTLSLSNGYYHVNFDRTYSEYFYLNGTLDFNAFKNGDTATNGMTIVIVAQFSSNAGNMERIFDFGSGTAIDNIIFSRNGTNGQVYFSLRNGSTQLATGGNSSNSSTLDVTQWHMYTVTFTNGTSVPINLYIDGQLVPFAANGTLATALINRSLTSCYIGRSNWGTDAYFTGNIRELIMYRTVLSSTELANLHTTLIKKWGLTDSSTAITLPLKVCHFDANDLTLSLSAGQKVSSWTNKANDVMVYPPAAMTANSTNLSSASWGKGTYVASASTEFSSTQFAFKAFDKIKYVIASGFINIWTSSAGGYNTSTGAQVRNTSTTMSSVAYLGDWLQIQMPQSITLTYYVLNIVLDRAPLTFYIGGSNDGTTWTLIDSRTGLSWGTTDTKGFYVNNTNAYTYYRIVINAVATPNNGSYASIGQWDLYGTHEGVYPITAMTANATTISSQIYGNGSYLASASSELDGTRQAWRVFNKAVGTTTNLGDYWHSSTSAGFQYNVTTGVYIGTTSTTISNVAYLGEWIQIRFPTPIRMTRYEISPRQDSTLYLARSPNTWYLAGSNDGYTWTLINSQSNITFGTSIQNFSVNSDVYYSHYRLVTTIVGNSNQTTNRDNVQIDLWNIYGIVPFTNYSPTTFNATQAVVNNQPLLEQEDGLYHVDFTRANSHHLQISNALDFNCFQNNTSAQNGITAIVVGRMTNPGSFEKFFDFANSTSNNDIFSFVRTLTNDLSVFVRNGTTDITWNAVGSTLPSSLDGKWHIYTVVMTNATTPTYQTYYDGNLVGSYIATTSTMIINRTTVNNYLGRPNAPANGYLEGGIREMVIYKQALQSGDLANIHWDLMKKWRIYPSASLTKEIVLSHKPLHFDVNDLVYSFGLGEGSQVTTWRNLGTDGARVDAIGTGTTGKPTLYKENGMWYVRSLSSDSQYFSITNDIPFNHLQDGDGNYVGGYTITCVVRINSLLNNSRILHMATANDNTNSLILCTNGTSDQLTGVNHNPTTSLLSQFNTTNDQGLSNWHVISYVFKNGSTTKAQFYVDGNLVNTSTQASLPLNNRVFKFVTIMGRNISPIDGDIREFILHRNVLTTTELNSLHTQLMTKWGINTLSSAIERFPPNLTSNSSSVAGVPYTVVASTEFSTSTQGWTLFDEQSSSWQSGSSNYNASTGDSIVTPALGTDDGYGGAWVYVTLPYGVVPKYYNLGGDMLTWRIYGNSSPSWEVGNWVALETRSKTALENYADVDRYQLPNATNTSYYAFAVKVKKSSMYSASGRCSLHTFNIFGTQTLPYNVFSPNLMGYFTTGDDIGNWDVIYETTSAKRDANNNTVYSQRNDANYTKPFTRVAYFMQNNMLDSNTTYWAFVSFNAWSADITTYRLPNVNEAFVIQDQTLANMNIYSNHPQVTQRTGATGLAHMWPYNIGFGSGASTFDYTNISTGTSDHGAFQIYDMTTTDPVMCWNRHRADSIPSIGFGKNDVTNIHYTVGSPTTHPNWVFSSTNAYNFKLKVMVR